MPDGWRGPAAARYAGAMIRRFQFSLATLFASTRLIATAMGSLLAATRCEPPWSVAVFIIACTICGAAFGCLARGAILGAILGYAAGLGLVVYALSTL